MSVPTTSTEKETNTLFPVFLKLETLRVLIVGGGNVGLEKLNAVIQNSPLTQVHLVGLTVSDDILNLAVAHPVVKISKRAFHREDLEHADIVIVAVNNRQTSAEIYTDAKSRGRLVNVADTPDLCDFYLSAVVKKGNLKIAISTNGKSPTVAKRLKELFAEMIPARLDDVLDNMHVIRQKLNGDFSEKVNRLNQLTSILVDGQDQLTGEKRWKRIATYCFFAFFFMFVGHLLFSYFPLTDIAAGMQTLVADLDSNFYWMIGTGFLAQLVDGALGMGYGVTCTTVLLSLGISLPAISGSIHTAEIFSSGVSGYSHYKFGNVNKKLFKALLVPGVLGSIVGALLLWRFGDQYAVYIRPLLAVYTLGLGIKIIVNALRRKREQQKVKRVGWLAGAGGFMDSFGGGGWGPLVTSTLISKGRSPRYVIGSVSMTEFFVTLASAVTFFAVLGVSHWYVIVGLLIGGSLAAPLAARLAGRLPMKSMLIAVGTLVVIWSLRILVKVIF